MTGDSVYGGSINHNGILYVRVTSSGAEGALAQIVRLVETAQLQKAPVQAYADKLASIFTPSVLAVAMVTFLVWCCLGYSRTIPRQWYSVDNGYGSPASFSMLFAISVVVISCPCALGLATPTAIMVGTSVGARAGILFKSGESFEVAQRWGALELTLTYTSVPFVILTLRRHYYLRVDTIVFDKTGTLTEGRPSLTDILVIEDGAVAQTVSGAL